MYDYSGGGGLYNYPQPQFPIPAPPQFQPPETNDFRALLAQYFQQYLAQQRPSGMGFDYPYLIGGNMPGRPPQFNPPVDVPSIPGVGPFSSYLIQNSVPPAVPAAQDYYSQIRDLLQRRENQPAHTLPMNTNPTTNNTQYRSHPFNFSN